jgi:predicted ATP-dependent serine protease
MKEAQKLGFQRAVLPESRRRPDRQSETNLLKKRSLGRLSQLVEVFGETDARQWVT